MNRRESGLPDTGWALFNVTELRETLGQLGRFCCFEAENINSFEVLSEIVFSVLCGKQSRGQIFYFFSNKTRMEEKKNGLSAFLRNNIAVL